MSHKGRPKDNIWSQGFTKIQYGKKITSRCNRCNTTWAGADANRLKNHRLEIDLLIVNIFSLMKANIKFIIHISRLTCKIQIEKDLNEDELGLQRTSKKIRTDSTLSLNLPSSSLSASHHVGSEDYSKSASSNSVPQIKTFSESINGTQPSLVKYIDAVTINEKNKLDRLFGGFVFSLKNPEEVIGSKELANFLGLLRPGYKIPSENELKIDILNACHAESKKNIFSRQVEYGSLILMTFKMMNTGILTSNGKVVFLRSYEMTSDPETIFSYLKDSVDIALDNYNVKITSLLSSRKESLNLLKILRPYSQILCKTTLMEQIIDDIKDETLCSEVKELLTAIDPTLPQ